MANFTAKAIKDAFLSLLAEKPLNKISVRDIVDACGINRNSFYYHFQDIPTLLEEIITEKMTSVIENYPTISNLEECFQTAFEFALQNQKAVYHIYNSVSRDVFERELLKLCESIVQTYISTAFPADAVDAADAAVFSRFIKCELFGLIIDWIQDGMNPTAIHDLTRVIELCKGLSAELIRRSRQS